MGEIPLAASDVERFYSGNRRIPFEHQKLNMRHVKSRKTPDQQFGRIGDHYNTPSEDKVMTKKTQ